MVKPKTRPSVLPNGRSTVTPVRIAAWNEKNNLATLDFTKLTAPPRQNVRSPLDDIEQRAAARLSRLTPMSVAERFTAFGRLGYTPWGLFFPDDPEGKAEVQAKIREIGNIADPDVRIPAYLAFQAVTGQWERLGIVGTWNGQQGLARSQTRFRIAAMGRRSGKTYAAAREILAVALMRPRSWTWLCAPTSKLVTRGWEEIVKLVQDLDLPTTVFRNSQQERRITLEETGATIEGMSTENILSLAGASVNFLVLDEAAQVWPEVWERGLLPPLTDTNGQALLISSYEGEGDFFEDKARKAEVLMQKARESGQDFKPDWELFTDQTWNNFFIAPQGRESPSIQQAEREMSPTEFLEQFGAIPAGAKERVYPEFKVPVHVGVYPFRPELPVYLACDPSSGINPYAIMVLQWDGPNVYVIDEFYETGATARSIAPILDQREWRGNVKEMIVDAASPDYIVDWNHLGYNAYPVPNKPQVQHRLPLVRNLLRDPIKYFDFHRRKVNQWLAVNGYEPDSDYLLDPLLQLRMTLEIEEGLGSVHLAAADVLAMRDCARLFVNVDCMDTITEFKMYSYNKRRQQNRAYGENPREFKDHLMDSLGYFTHTHRFELFDAGSLRQNADHDYLDSGWRQQHAEALGMAVEAAEVVNPNVRVRSASLRPGTFLHLMRERTTGGPDGGRDLLR